MDKIIRLALSILYLPLNWISHVSPRSNSILIFGSWFGQSYTDNSKHLFEYANSVADEKMITCVWLSANPAVVMHVKKLGYRSYSFHSIMGIYFMLRAKYGIISAGKGDLNPYLYSKRIKIINLFHGAPLKKILFDDKITFKEPPRILSTLFPFYRSPKYSLICASSEAVKKTYVSAFRVAPSVVNVTGFPRVDPLISHRENKRNGSNGKVKGIYLPTHRGEGDQEFAKKFRAILEELDEAIGEFHNIELDLKLHFYYRNNRYNFKNIKFLQEEGIGSDVYEKLHEYDFLITDYSSIFFDYLPLNRPVIFFPFDFDEYLAKDRELYYEYDEIIPGAKVLTIRQLTSELRALERGDDHFIIRRQKINALFNQYDDGKNCERVLQSIIILSNE